MIELTPLDHAHSEMEGANDDSAARLKYYERLADSELFILLTQEAAGDTIEPEIFDLGDAQFVLLFDREERLAQFVGKPAPYAALSGRVIAQMLAGQGVGFGVNLDVAPSQMLIPPEAVAWLAETLSHAPTQMQAHAEEFLSPTSVPEQLLRALDTKLATAAGLARNAYLASVRYADGTQGHILGFLGTAPGAENALAQAVNEALTFSGLEAGSLDVGFFEPKDPAAPALAKVGLRFELPVPTVSQTGARPAPGSDPDRPPILK